MNQPIGIFPFGQPVNMVTQQDRAPKSIFVLGVYASAVHARWFDATGKQRVKALAVASEPSIFWRGEGVEGILAGLEIPQSLGWLEPAASNLNGPSGQVLDSHFLNPLGYERAEAWLCDLVPHSCMNDGQARAIAREYEPLRQMYDLPSVSVPSVPAQLADAERRGAIYAELLAAKAPILLTLGDEPLKWFVAPLSGCHKRLQDFGDSPTTYGQMHDIQIDGKSLKLLPLVHPRQAGRLGVHSTRWAALHDAWMASQLPSIDGA